MGMSQETTCSGPDGWSWQFLSSASGSDWLQAAQGGQAYTPSYLQLQMQGKVTLAAQEQTLQRQPLVQGQDC